MEINFQKTLLFAAIVLLVSNAKVNAQWSLSGNAAAAGNFIGTTNAVDFATRTNNLERIRVTAAGNVGIGTTLPGYKLQVEGDIYANQGALLVSKNSNEGGQVSVFNHGKTGSGLRAFYSIYNMTGFYGNKLSIWAYPLSGSGNERFSIWDNGDFTFHNASSNAMVYFLNNGNVGIGTATPSSRLQINTTGTENALDVVSSGVVNFRVKSTGYIYARDLTVLATTFPDYVFSKEYKLMPLSEVRSFIEKHSRLPEMPSAQEVEKDGMSVSKVNTLLVQKVEELTLYVIKLQEEVDQLKNQK